MMADVAEKLETPLPPAIRRYQTADIQKHAAWLFPRLERSYPHMSRAQLYTWLLGALQNNDFIPFYHDCGIALATMVSQPLRPNAYVEEVFVYLEDAALDSHQFVGGHFYKHIYSWAQQRGIKTVFIETNTDVSRRAIAEATGIRVFENKQAYMRV